MEHQVQREPTFDDPAFRNPAAYHHPHSSMHSLAETPTEKRLSEKSSLAFRTISEVADDLEVPQHVLRFWESKFSQVKPLKRGGGRRYYRPEDIELLRRIKNYLYKQGYTIKGVQRLLKESRTMATPSQSFVPYAHPQPLAGAGMPSYQMPSAVMQKATASLLQAAAAAPSVMAMAYGAVSNTLHAEGEKVKEFANKTQRFADAFEEITIAEEKVEAGEQTQMERSLEAVTTIRDELSHAAQPLRVETRAEVLQSLEAAPQEPEQPAVEIIEETVAEEVVEVLAAPAETTVESASAVDAEYDESAPDVYDDTADVFDDEVAQDAPAPSSFGMAHQQELKGILADLVALREMLNDAVAA